MTFTQSQFDQHNDYVEKDINGNTTAMWADYYSSTEPIVPEIPEDTLDQKIICNIKTSTSSIKVGGSYKLLTAQIFKDEDFEITDNYSSTDFIWTCKIDDTDYTEQVIWLKQKNHNQIKVKFPNNREFLNKILVIQCSVGTIVGEVKLELIV